MIVNATADEFSFTFLALIKVQISELPPVPTKYIDIQKK